MVAHELDHWMGDQGAELEPEGRRARSYRQLQQSWQVKRPSAYAAYVARHAVPSGSQCDCCSSRAELVRCMDCKVSVPIKYYSLTCQPFCVLRPMGKFPCRGLRHCCAMSVIRSSTHTSTSTGGRPSCRDSLSLCPPALLSRLTTTLRRPVSVMPLQGD